MEKNAIEKAVVVVVVHTSSSVRLTLCLENSSTGCTVPVRHVTEDCAGMNEQDVGQAQKSVEAVSSIAKNVERKATLHNYICVM